MEKQELIELFERFLNEAGQWVNFKSWLEEQGYTLSELGFPNNED